MTVLGDVAAQLSDTPQLYHVGLVVPDVAAAVEQYSALFGLRFTSIRRATLDIRVDGVARSPELLVSYSMDGPSYVELVEECSGATWAADALGLNHIGFWARDLTSASARLDAAGWPRRLHDDGAGGPPREFIYHQGAGGVWIELVTAHFAVDLESWIAASEAGELS